MQKKEKVLISAAASLMVVCSVLIAGILITARQSGNAVFTGSVEHSSEYHATSTRNFDGTAMTNLSVLPASDTFGSVVITGAGAGVMNFYDATTSNITQRGNTATSSILLTTIPASTAAGTYTFDQVVRNGGILVEIIGAAPTSTETFR